MKQMTRQEIQEKIDILKKNKKNPKANVVAIDKKIVALQNELKSMGKNSAPKKDVKEKVVEKPKTTSVSFDEIVNSEMKRHRKHWELHKLGVSKEEIAKLTGSTTSNIGRDILFYKKGKLKED